jgi:O-methyltransferase
MRPAQTDAIQLQPKISLNRIFQIPQMFRPTVSRFLGNTLGHVNLERAAIGLTAVASWVRFARWRRMHPVARPNDPRERSERAFLYESVIRKEGLDRTPLDFWEFGVFRGDSLLWWLRNLTHPESRFVGFDTFTGLPERWRPTEPAGWFNAHGELPETKDPRCRFEVGLFQDTLPDLVRRHDFSRRLVIHLDADLFTATLFVLTSLARSFKPGDIVFFDNFICQLDEFRAFEEFVQSFRVRYEVLGAVGEYTRVCVKIL